MISYVISHHVASMLRSRVVSCVCFFPPFPSNKPRYQTQNTSAFVHRWSLDFATCGGPPTYRRVLRRVALVVVVVLVVVGSRL
jgi:hypothetical protein